jgi:peptide chain release factor 1
MLLAEELDPEMKEMAELEYEELSEKKKKLEQDLKILLLPKDPNDEKNVIVENQGWGRRR